MNWDDEKSTLGRQVRDNKGQLLGYIKRDPVTGNAHVFGANGSTLGWSKPHNNSGPGYTLSSKEGRIAHTDTPELLIRRKNEPKR